jgi:hypothetical protein
VRGEWLDPYDESLSYFIAGVYDGCTSLKDITFKGNWIAEIVRVDEGGIIWHELEEYRKPPKVFSDRWMRDDLLLGVRGSSETDSVWTDNDQTRPVTAVSWFYLVFIRPLAACLCLGC